MKSLLPLFRFSIPFRPGVRNYLYHSPNPSMYIEKNSLYPPFFIFKYKFEKWEGGVM